MSQIVLSAKDTIHMDIDEIVSAFGSDRWKEISALYSFDGQSYYELEETKKQIPQVKPYFKSLDINQNDINAKKKPAIEVGLKLSF